MEWALALPGWAKSASLWVPLRRNITLFSENPCRLRVQPTLFLHCVQQHGDKDAPSVPAPGGDSLWFILRLKGTAKSSFPFYIFFHL